MKFHIKNVEKFKQNQYKEKYDKLGEIKFE